VIRGGLVLMALAALSCGSKGGGTSMTDAGDAGGGVDALGAYCAQYMAYDAAGPPPFAAVQKIFDDNCTTCHIAGDIVDLSEGHAYMDLVGQPSVAPETCGGTLVVPGQPDASYLYQKLTNDIPCYGSRMPRTEFGSVPLPDCVTNVVRDWIAAGAPNQPGAGDAAAE
jgi:hypothetical protein